MIYLEDVPLGVGCSEEEGEEKKSASNTAHDTASCLVLAVTGNPYIQQANSAFVGSHLSLSRSLPRTKKCIHVLQNETASVEYEVDDAVLASDDATTCVIAVVVCRATGVASIAHFDELSSGSDLCFRKFMSQHVGGRHCTYEAYLVGGMREETLVGYRTAGNLLRQMNRSPGKFNVRLCCVYDQNTCTQTGCSLARSFAFDPLTQTAYHVSTSILNLGLASIHRNLSQKNLQDALQVETREEKKRVEIESDGAPPASVTGKEKEEQLKEKEKEKKVLQSDCQDVKASPPLLSKGKRSLSSGFGLDKLATVASNQQQHPHPHSHPHSHPHLNPLLHRGPGLDRRLAHYWLSGFDEQQPLDLMNVYDTWDQKFVLTGRIHAVPRCLLVNYAYLLTLSDKDLLERTSTTPLHEGENFCSDVRLALNFILQSQGEAPNFTLYTQRFTWDPTGGVWMEVDKHTGKKMKHLQLQDDFHSIHLHHHHHQGGHHRSGAHNHITAVHTNEPVVDVPGSSWSYTSLVDLEKEHLCKEAAGV